jgi:hypothetical protein
MRGGCSPSQCLFIDLYFRDPLNRGKFRGDNETSRSCNKLDWLRIHSGQRLFSIKVRINDALKDLLIHRRRKEMPDRNDVVVFENQSDDIPQTLRLKWYQWSRGRYYREVYPHPLLCSRSGAITEFPDHMHEGEIVIPDSLDAPVPRGNPAPASQSL